MQKIKKRHTLTMVAGSIMDLGMIPRLYTRSDCNLDHGLQALRSQRYASMRYPAGPKPEIITLSTPTSQQPESKLTILQAFIEEV